MMKKLLRPVAPALAAAALVAGRAAPAAARIDELITVLFQPAEYEQAALSPDGSHLAITREYNDHKVLLTLNLTSGEMKALRQDANKDVGNVHWTGPDALFFELIR